MDQILAGDRPRIPAASAWRHFIEHEWETPRLVEALLAFQRRFDWDIVKVHPRASYYGEAWGAQYDRTDYGGGVIARQTRAVRDLDSIGVLSLDGETWAQQLEVVGLMRKALGPEVPMIQTVFSPLSVLSQLAGGRAKRDTREQSPLVRAIAENPVKTHRALGAIAATLAGYARECLRAGADGIFFAVTGAARQDQLTESEYREFGRPYDLQVLAGVREAALNILHNCGAAVFFDLLLDYPVHAISWAPGEGGNPTMAEAARRTPKVLVGGVDAVHVLRHESAEAVAQRVADAVMATGGRRLVIAPGCSAHPQVPEANLDALRGRMQC
jgi:uroporphyrinogen decarboxylase